MANQLLPEPYLREVPEGMCFFLLYPTPPALLTERGKAEYAETEPWGRRIPRGTVALNVTLLPGDVGCSFQIPESDEVYWTHSPNIFAVDTPQNRVCADTMGKLDQVVVDLQLEKGNLCRSIQSLGDIIRGMKNGNDY